MCKAIQTLNHGIKKKFFVKGLLDVKGTVLEAFSVNSFAFHFGAFAECV